MINPDPNEALRVLANLEPGTGILNAEIVRTDDEFGIGIRISANPQIAGYLTFDITRNLLMSAIMKAANDHEAIARDLMIAEAEARGFASALHTETELFGNV